MTDLAEPLEAAPRHASRARAAAAVVGLALALLLDVFLTYLAFIGSYGPLNASGGRFLLILPAVVFVAALAALFVGASRVSRILPPADRRPTLQPLAAAAVAFILASGLDAALVIAAWGIDVVNPEAYVLTIRTVVAVTWVGTAVVWALGAVVSELRRRIGLPHRWVVVVAGVAMGVLQVAVWVYLSSPLAPQPGAY